MSRSRCSKAIPAEFLRGIRCDELPDYFFGRPGLPEAAATHFANGAPDAR